MRACERRPNVNRPHFKAYIDPIYPSMEYMPDYGSSNMFHDSVAHDHFMIVERQWMLTTGCLDSGMLSHNH